MLIRNPKASSYCMIKELEQKWNHDDNLNTKTVMKVLEGEFRKIQLDYKCQ